MVGPEPNPPPNFEKYVEAFQILVSSLNKQEAWPTHSQFVKKLDQIIEIQRPQTFDYCKALA